MKIPYIKIPIADVAAYLAPFNEAFKGRVFQAVLDFGLYQKWADLECSEREQVGYTAVKEIVENEIKSYKKFCKEQKQKIKKRWGKNEFSDGTAVLPPLVYQTETETEAETDINKLLTAQHSCAGPEPQKTEPEKIKTGPVKKSETPLFGGDRFLKKKRELNQLQRFSNEVLAQYEEPMNSKQKGIWFKRNCRCLTDILNFCGNDIPLALATIGECVERLEKAGLSGGYEAVCRNLPEYYAAAKKKLEVNNAKNATNTNTVRAF